MAQTYQTNNMYDTLLGCPVSKGSSKCSLPEATEMDYCPEKKGTRRGRQEGTSGTEKMLCRHGLHDDGMLGLRARVKTREHTRAQKRKEHTGILCRCYEALIYTC